jgi:16S rRNA (guanine527-N7)-methyltransferase
MRDVAGEEKRKQKREQKTAPETAPETEPGTEPGTEPKAAPETVPAELSEEEAGIERWAEVFGVPVSTPVRDSLVTYARLLLTWGQTINLTAAKTMGVLVSQHFPDAFAIAGRLSGQDEREHRIIDVGSGGGVPALPLALLRPGSSFALFEATGKKVAFLRTAIRELKLGHRVRVEPTRVALPTPAEGSFDVAVSRATFAPEIWLNLAWHLVRPGGTVFYLGTERLTAWPSELRLDAQSSYRPDRWVAGLRRST